MELKELPLESAISTSGITVVDYHADWCGPCKAISPVIESLEKSLGFTLIKVNTEEFPDLTSDHEITSLPTLEFYKDGKLVDRKVGALPKTTLEKLIGSL